MRSDSASGFIRLYAAAFIFAVTSVFVKAASTYYSGPFISSARFVIGAVLCVIGAFATKGSVKPVNKKAVILRGLFGSFAMFATYMAISLTGPGRATLLSNTYPVFVAIFGTLFFGEKTRLKSIAALVVCTLGSALVVGDGSGSSFLGDALALGSAILAGIAVNFVRVASATDSPYVLYLSPCLFGLPMLFIGIPTVGSFDLAGLGLVLAVGVLAFAAQILMSSGYRTVPAGKGSMVFYIETVLTILLGMLFGERPAPLFWIGFAIIAAGLVLNQVPGPPSKNQTDAVIK